MKRKKILVSILLLFTLFLGGCFSYKDMNRLHFITLAIADKDPAGRDVLYTESFAAYRGNTQEGGTIQRVLLETWGNTLPDALANIQTTAPFPTDYSVNKAIILTEKIAKEGIGPYLNGFERDQDISKKTFLFIYEDDPAELLNLEIKDEPYLGIYLENIMTFQGNQSRLLSIRLNDYLNERLQGSGINLLPIIEIQKEAIGERVEVTAAAVLVNDKMVDKISEDEILLYKLLNGDASHGEFSVPHPNEKGQFISLNILDHKVKENLSYDGYEATLSFDIKGIASIQAAEGPIKLLDENTRQDLINNAQNSSERNVRRFFEKFQERDIDLLDVKNRVEQKYPHADLKDILQRTKIEVNTEIEIQGSQVSTDFH